MKHAALADAYDHPGFTPVADELSGAQHALWLDRAATDQLHTV